MIQLPATFEKNGFVFQQLAREGRVALFQRKSKAFKYSDFEIIRVQKHNGYTVKKGTPDEKFIEPSEVYPSSTTWGTYGITKTKEPDAREAFEAWAKKYANAETEDYNPDAKKTTRGRPALNIELVFPAGEFTVQELAESHKVSTGYIHVHLKPLLANGDVEMIGARKVTAGRGKPTNYYKFKGKKETPAKKKAAAK